LRALITHHACASVTSAPHRFPGMSECVCQEGFVEVEGQGCVPAGRSGAAGGAGAGGKGAAASGADPNQKHHVTCQQMFGPHAQFDGVDSCECKDGFSQVLPSVVPKSRRDPAHAFCSLAHPSSELLMCCHCWRAGRRWQVCARCTSSPGSDNRRTRTFCRVRGVRRAVRSDVSSTRMC
jgi:hypothetical protein